MSVMESAGVVFVRMLAALLVPGTRILAAAAVKPRSSRPNH